MMWPSRPTNSCKEYGCKMLDTVFGLTSVQMLFSPPECCVPTVL